MAVVVLGRPLSLLYQMRYFHPEYSGSTFDMSIFLDALSVFVCVLLGGNRSRALISASFAFSIICLAQLPVIYFIGVVVYPATDTQGLMDMALQFPYIYYTGVFFTNVIIAVCCFLAAHWLGKADKKLPVKLYVLFNLLFVFFTLIVLIFWNSIATVWSISFLASAFMTTLFLVMLVFLFYLYIQLAKCNDRQLKETESPLVGEYAPFIQRLSRRELEVIEAILAGNFSYKELSAILNISVNTVKTHLKHIYQTTGVSSITALLSLFRGYIAPPP